LFKPDKTIAAILFAGILGSAGVEAQATGALRGRVVDAETGNAVVDATVILEGAERSALTDPTGAFGIENVPAGAYALRVVHLAYGEFSQQVRIEPGQDLGLRIRLSQTAIELDPMVVEAVSEEQFQARSRGTRRNVITREDVARFQDTGGHLGHILARRIPGIRLRTDQSRSGEPICIEFRSPVSLQDPLSCKPPVVFVDGARMFSAGFVLTTLPTEHIERIEAIPPGEAGVAYGADSRYGVLVIETRTASSVLGEVDEEPRLASGIRYDWALEPEPHQSKKVFGFALLGTAAGIAPQVGASLAARYAGGTEMSRGRLGYQLVAASLLAAPGLILSLTSSEDAFAGSSLLGNLLLGLGVPMAVTLADRMFRGVRPGGTAPR
jgi:hypothetical protein